MVNKYQVAVDGYFFRSFVAQNNPAALGVISYNSYGRREAEFFLQKLKQAAAVDLNRQFSCLLFEEPHDRFVASAEINP